MKEFIFRRFWLILPFQLRWAYQISHLLNSEYQTVICGMFFFKLILGDMLDVTGYLIPQLSPKARKRQFM